MDYLDQITIGSTIYDIRDSSTYGKTLPSGGDPNDILIKNSSTDYDAVWSSDTTHVLKAGDTMTGNLTVCASYAPTMILKNPNLQGGGTPLTDIESACLFIKDGTDTNVGWLQLIQWGGGGISLDLKARKILSNVEHTNGLRLSVGATGDAEVTLDSAGAWRDALELGSPTKVTTLSSIVNASTNATITSANYVSWGKMAMVHVEATRSINTGANTDITIATLVSGKRPAIQAPCNLYYNAANVCAYINTSGNIRFKTSSSIPSGTTLTFDATYILA